MITNIFDFKRSLTLINKFCKHLCEIRDWSGNYAVICILQTFLLLCCNIVKFLYFKKKPTNIMHQKFYLFLEKTISFFGTYVMRFSNYSFYVFAHCKKKWFLKLIVTKACCQSIYEVWLSNKETGYEKNYF